MSEDGISIRPVHGLPEFAPGDDLAAEIARCAPWLADGDVVVVTSKVVSKVEGALVRVPPDADREAARQALEVSRGRGRPRGSSNKRTAKWRDYLAGRYAHLLEVLAQTISRTPAELAESGGIYAQLLRLQKAGTKEARKMLKEYGLSG